MASLIFHFATIEVDLNTGPDIHSTIALPIRRGELRLGTWQQVVAVNHDNRTRRRSIEVTLSGT